MARCLYNKPTINRELPEILPGTLMTLDEQCYHAGALDACYVIKYNYNYNYNDND